MAYKAPFHPLRHHLTAFFDALVAAGAAPGTATQFKTTVGGILTNAASEGVSISSDFLDDEDEKAAPRARAVRRLAWRKFAEYLASQGVDVPTYERRKAGRPRNTVTKRDVLITALFSTLGTHTFNHVEALRWRDVKLGVETGEIRFTMHGRATPLSVSRAWLDAVREVGFPYSTPEPDAPLFPAEPESTRALSAARAERIIRRTLDAIHRKEVAPWKKPATVVKTIA